MTVLIKAAAAGAAGSVMALLLKRSAPELGFALSAAVCLLAAALAAQTMAGLTDLLSVLREETALSPAVVTPVFKCVGIGIVTRLSAELCRDAGEAALGSVVETAGAVCALLVALPLLRTVLELLMELMA